MWKLEKVGEMEEKSNYEEKFKKSQLCVTFQHTIDFIYIYFSLHSWQKLKNYS